MPKELTWRRAIEKVLADAEGAMHYKDIAEEIVSRGLRVNVGATPPATVSANLTTSIAKDGDASPFQKVGRGAYILKHKQQSPEKNKQEAGEAPEQAQESEDQYDIISSFGMFWRRDFVDWNSSPKLLGMQQIGAEPVDFYRQVGFICCTTVEKSSM